MQKRLIHWLFAFEGRITARSYFIAALALVAVKYGIDHSIAAHYQVRWPLTVYVLPAHDFNIFGTGSQHPQMFAVLWLVALPFFWAGIALTLRRLRDAGLRSAWLLLFFIPVANFLLFVLLSVLSSRSSEATLEDESSNTPLNPNAPLLGFVFAVLVGVLLAIFSASYLAQYAWGLFLGVPFLIGFIASWFFNARFLHTRADTSAVASLTVLIVGLCLLGFRFEGLICLAMAVPLAIPLAIGGGLAARSCLASRARYLRGSSSLSVCIAVLPALMLVEYVAKPEPPVHPVTTSILINAPAKLVWKNVVAFSPLDEPKEWFFRTGIAYPIGATITGTGAGAVRRCRFSTGDFVEPITVWDEDNCSHSTFPASRPRSLKSL